MSPSKRRRAVEVLQSRLGLSQRRACQIVGQHRSTQRDAPPCLDSDAVLRALRTITGISPELITEIHHP